MTTITELSTARPQVGPSHPVRVIARLDVKGRRLVKGVNLEGLKVLGDPLEFIDRYLRMGVDEIAIFDVNASLYGFEHDYEYLSLISHNVNIPITAGGGVASVDMFERVLNAGADKVAVNTTFTRDPGRISEFARVFGSQAVVLYVESKVQIGGTYNDGSYRAYTENGRSRTQWKVEEWVAEAQDRGIGEVFLTSVDAEGRCGGFDADIIKAVAPLTRVPLIVNGGFGMPAHVELLREAHIDGIAVAAAFHYGKASVADVKNSLVRIGMTVRHDCGHAS